jgi:hypothetical protein
MGVNPCQYGAHRSEQDQGQEAVGSALRGQIAHHEQLLTQARTEIVTLDEQLSA